MEPVFDWRARQARPFLQFRNPVAKEYFKRIHERVFFDGKNNFQLVIGEPGSAKSLTTVYYGLALTHWFGPETFPDTVFYTPSGFFESLEKVKSVGDVLIWDEFGVGLPKREWWKASSLAVNKIFQIFRGAGETGTYKGRVFFFLVAPDQSYVDSQALKLCNGYSVCSSKAGKYWFRPYRLSYDRFMGKTYRQLFRFTVDHVQAKVTNFRRPLLSGDLVESYEALSRPSKNKLIKEFIEFGLVDDMSRRGFEREFVSELVDELVADPQGIEECKGLGGRLSSDMVYSHFSGKGISKNVAVRVTKEVRERLTSGDRLLRNGQHGEDGGRD